MLSIMIVIHTYYCIPCPYECITMLHRGKTTLACLHVAINFIMIIIIIIIIILIAYWKF